MNILSLFSLKKSTGPRDLELSMAGLKLGDSVLQICGSDYGLITTLAKAVGLSGQAFAIARTQHDAETFERGATDAGVLVDVKVATLEALPFKDDFFDLVVIKQVLGELTQNDRVRGLQEALRVLRTGGRCLIIDPSMRGGLGAILSRQSLDPRYIANGGPQGALEQEGFHGVRLLAERDGLRFVEGAKSTQT
jgi:ubiquinone/menaquinone biosynthesis C-methylase UbiE